MRRLVIATLVAAVCTPAGAQTRAPVPPPSMKPVMAPVAAPVVQPLDEDAASGKSRTPVGQPAAPVAADETLPVEEKSAAKGDGEMAELTPRAIAVHDQSIYVLQERNYSKRGKFEITPFALSGLNPKFVGYLGMGVSAAYHIRENLAVEATTSLPFLFYSYYSDLVYEVYQYEGLTPEAVDLKQMNYFGSVSLQFSALYGKLRFYDWLIDYDFYASAGGGVVRTVETCNPLDADCSNVVQEIGRGLRRPSSGSDEFKISGNLALGMRFFFSESLGLKAEVRDIAYADRAVDRNATSSDVRNNLLLFLGISLII
jgi:outer membrane beta-barrel protein